jgi:chaperonin cofactor prefoldin
MFYPHLLNDTKKRINRNEKLAMIKVLKNVKEIFIIIDLQVVLKELSDDIERLEKEIER